MTRATKEPLGVGAPGTVLGTVPGASRRQQYSASTKRALVDVAAALFTEHGYAGTSLDAIVGGAQVTKGALYHHFSGKQALFEAVFNKTEKDATAVIGEALRTSKDPWERATAGLRAFLDVVQEPAYRRIVIQEGPAVLGYERFREQEERSTFRLVQDLVSSVFSSADVALGEPMTEIVSRIFFGAMSSAGESVADAEDARLASARVEAAIAYLIAAIRTLAESGVGLEDPAQTGRSADQLEADVPAVLGHQAHPDLAGRHGQRS